MKTAQSSKYVQIMHYQHKQQTPFIRLICNLAETNCTENIPLPLQSFNID